MADTTCVSCGDVKQTKTNKYGKEVCEECFKVCCAECNGEFGEDCPLPLHEGSRVCADCDPNLGDEEEEENWGEDFWCLRCSRQFRSWDGEECVHCGYCPRLDGEVEQEDEEDE